MRLRSSIRREISPDSRREHRGRESVFDILEQILSVEPNQRVAIGTEEERSCFSGGAPKLPVRGCVNLLEELVFH